MTMHQDRTGWCQAVPCWDCWRMFLFGWLGMRGSVREDWEAKGGDGISMVFRPTAGVVLISVKPSLENMFTLREWPALIEDMPETQVFFLIGRSKSWEATSSNVICSWWGYVLLLTITPWFCAAMLLAVVQCLQFFGRFLLQIPVRAMVRRVICTKWDVLKCVNQPSWLTDQGMKHSIARNSPSTIRKRGNM